MALATRPFWLDGGYDRDAVEACPCHPDHRWWTFKLSEVLEPGRMHNPNELMVICRGCYVPRCGHSTDTNPCMSPRHHEEPHRYVDGTRREIGR
jgi:hypothetical protein